MEDSHIADLDLGNGLSFFGVYDGHGGNFSKFSSNEFNTRQRSGRICAGSYGKWVEIISGV